MSLRVSHSIEPQGYHRESNSKTRQEYTPHAQRERVQNASTNTFKGAHTFQNHGHFRDRAVSRPPSSAAQGRTDQVYQRQTHSSTHGERRNDTSFHRHSEKASRAA